MSSLLNRTISLVSNDGKRNNSNNMLRINSEKMDSPLKIFVLAKKTINEIFDDIYRYVQQSHTFIEEANDNCNDVVNTEHLSRVYNFMTKIKAIEDVLSRDHMKVAF